MSVAHSAFGHVLKRGLDVAQAHFQGPSEEHMEKLQQDAQLYESAGPEMDLKAREFLPLIITGFVCLFLIASIRYTIGTVMASLAMIESPSATAIIESKGPPAYSDIEADAPLEKEALIAEDVDVEVTVIDRKPITSSIKATIGHLHRVGGFFGRWRGLGLSILYHFVHNVITNLFAGLLGFGAIGYAVIYVMVSVSTCRLHMVWTHSMISAPSNKRWYRRFVARKDCKVLLLPSLVFAVAQQATFILPVAVAFALGIQNIGHEDVFNAADKENCAHMGLLALRFIAVPATALLVGIAVLLPASVTLTRIEAALLPEGEETIVPFDRAAIMGDIDVTARGGSRAVFVEAWRSFDRAARGRLMKIYAKMVLAQVSIAIIGVHLAVAELYVIGGDRLALFFKSAAAQLQIMAIEAQQANN